MKPRIESADAALIHGKCSDCIYRWLGSPDPKIYFVLWHCRKPNEPMVVIPIIKEAKGCGDFKK